MFGDTIFAVGAIAFVLFVLGLSTGHSYKPAGVEGATTDPGQRASPRAHRVGRASCGRARVRSIGAWSAAS